MQTLPPSPSQDTIKMWISRNKSPKRLPKPGKKFLIGSAITVSTITLVASSVLILQHARSRVAIPENVVKSVNFPVYYPKHMPKNVAYVKDSEKISPNVLLYTLDNNGVKIHVSVQPKPAGVVFEDFYNRVLKNKADIFSNQGKGVIGTAQGSTIGSLVTDKVWVLINTSSTVDGQTFSQIVTSLAKL